MIKISEISLRSINRAFYSLWYKFCTLTGRVAVLETNASAKNVFYVQSLTDIITVDGTSIDEILVGDEFTGGTFLKYSGVYADDGGVVLTDLNGQKWKREIDGHIDIRWFGAYSVTIQQFDSSPAINAAYTAAKSKEIIPIARLYIPAVSTSTNWYYCASGITFDNYVEVFGDGITSHIRFNGNVGGFTTTYITSRYSKFSDFQLSAYSSVTPDYTKPGLLPKDIIYVDNITIKEFPDGVQLIASIPAGNVNNSVFNDLHVIQNKRHGVYIQGSDANNITFYNLDAINNGASGVLDKSFLGNHYYTCHFASNCSPTLSFQKGLVISGGVVYVSIVENNIGIEPGVTAGWATSWATYTGLQAWLVGFPDVAAWSAGTTYYIGSPYTLEGANQWGSMNNVYIEGDQPLSTLAPRCTSFGGNPQYRTQSATLESNSSVLYTKSALMVGVPGSSTTIKAQMQCSDSTNGLSGVSVFETSTNGVWLDYFTGTAFGGKMGGIRNSAGSSATRFLTSNSTATTTGRTNAPAVSANLALLGQMYFSFNSNRSTLRELDFTTGGNGQYTAAITKDYGDMVLATKTFYSEKSEIVGFKLIETTLGATKKWVGIKGYEEQVITNITGTYVVGREYNTPVGRGVLYDVTFVGTSGTDNCVIQRRALCKNTGGTMSTINNQEIGTSLRDATFATVDINFSFFTGSGNDDIEVQIINLPAATYGKVNIKRVDY